MLCKFRAFCLKLTLVTALISLTYASSSTTAPCQALVAESPVALPPVSVETHMPYDTVSTVVIERSPLGPDRGRTIVCRICGDTMRNFRTVSSFGVRPEQFMSRCPSCKGVDTKEVKLVA